MTILSDSVLVESKSARDHQLERMPHEAAHSILEKVKGLYFALWHGVGVSTTEQMKGFYEVSVDTVRSAFKRHKGEFVSDGVRELTGKELKSLRDIGHGIVQLPESTTRALIWTPRSALRLGLVLEDSAVAKAVRTSLLDSVEHVIPALVHENERTKLELQLMRAKQKYQDSGYAIQLSTSAATLAWLRGETPPPPRIEYVDRFLDSRTGKEVGSISGRSLTQLIADVGLNPKSKRDKDRVKHALKRWGFDYDRMENWSEASYLRKYPVLKDEIYDQALKAVLNEVMTGESNQNLFVHQMQQEALSPQKQSRVFQGAEP